MEIRHKVKFPTSIELDAWWATHQKNDIARREREKIEKEVQDLEKKVKTLKKKLGSK
jgi:DNA gyrase/topoisomerase IV subunit A